MAGGVGAVLLWAALVIRATDGRASSVGPHSETGSTVLRDSREHNVASGTSSRRAAAERDWGSRGCAISESCRFCGETLERIASVFEE